MKVTGVVINDKLGVPKWKWRNLRALLHNVKVGKRKLLSEEFYQLRGYIEWIRNLDPNKGAYFLKEFKAITS